MKTLSALALSLAFAAPALAQDGPEPPVTEHSFDDAEDVEGGRLGPHGTLVAGGVKRLPRRSLVRPRTQFVPELLKSVEDL